MKNPLREMFGVLMGQQPAAVGVPDERYEITSPCSCGCPSCPGCDGNSSCGCGSCAEHCPDCGGLMSDEVCQTCGHSDGMGCPECGGVVVEGTCDECGYSESLSEGKRRKGPSKKTQKKIAKTIVKKAGKGKDKKVSMTKLAKAVGGWADDPWAAAQWTKQVAKK